MEATATGTPDLVSIRVTDWRQLRSAHLKDVPRNATVREIMTEVQRLMELSLDSSYQLLSGDRALNQMDTLAEAGIASDAEIEIVPDVEAG